MNVLNLKMMAHPLNWVTLAVWLFAGALVLGGSGLLQNTDAND